MLTAGAGRRVALLAATGLVLAGCASSHHPAAAPTPTPSASPALGTLISAPPLPTPVPTGVVGSWDARLISLGSYFEGSLASDGSSLYAVTTDGRLDRVTPGHGITASAVVGTQANAVVVTPPDHHIWVVSSVDPNKVVLRRYTLPALRVAGTLEWTVAPALAGLTPTAVASPDGSRLYVGGSTSVVVVDTSTDKIISRVPAGSDGVSGLAISPDGTTLYVGSTPGGGAQASVTSYDLPSLRTEATIPGALGEGTIAASGGGLWEVGGTGHENPVVFSPFRSPGQPLVEPSGGGGLYPSVTVVGHLAYISGYPLACANAETGHVYATTTATDASGAVTSVIEGVAATDNGQLYGIFHSQDQSRPDGIARLTPPTACRP